MLPNNPAHDKLLREVVRHYPNSAVFLFDHEYRYVLADGEALRNAGYQVELLVGKTLFEVLPEETVHIVQPVYDAALSGKVLEIDRFTRGRNYWIQGRPIFNDDGAVELGMIVTQDTTELWKAQKRAKEADRLKDEFLGVIGHEIRTPLTGILGTAKLLQSGVVSKDKERELFQLLVRSCETLDTIIEKLLNFSKLRTGNFSYQFADCKVNTLLEKIYNLYISVFQQTGRDFIVQYCDPTLELRIDQAGVLQVLANLINNARKHGQGTVTLSSTVHENNVQFSIRDEGPGVPNAEKERIFKPFFQMDSSNTREAKGVGLGLAIAKKIVDAHQGQIGIEESPKTGAHFWVSFPI